jgi:hypothetical protein
MSMLRIVLWRSARSMVKWLSTHERRNPEIIIKLDAAARYRRATVRSSLDDAHPGDSTLHTGAVRPHYGFVGKMYSVLSRTGHRSQVLEMLPFFRSFCGRALFVREMMHQNFLVGPLGFRRGGGGGGAVKSGD